MGILCCSIIHIQGRDTTHCASAEHTLPMEQYVWVKCNTTDASTMAAIQAFYHALVHMYTHTYTQTHTAHLWDSKVLQLLFEHVSTPVRCTQNDRHNTES